MAGSSFVAEKAQGEPRALLEPKNKDTEILMSCDKRTQKPS